MIVLGSEQPHHLSYKRLRTALGTPSIRADLDRVEKGQVARIVELLLLTPELLRGYAPNAQLNTDDRPGIEFDAPRALFTNTSAENLADIIEQQRGRPMAAPISDLLLVNDGVLVASAMGLSVRGVEISEMNKARTQWLLTWQRQSASSRHDLVGVGSELTLSWQDGPIKTHVTRNILSNRPTESELGSRVLSLLPIQAARLGQIELADSIAAVGAISASASGRGFTLGLVWLCTAEQGELASYTARREVPEPGAADGWALLVDLAGRLQCI